MPVLIQSHLAYQIIRAFQAAYVGHRLQVECREKSSRNVNCLRFHEMSFKQDQKWSIDAISFYGWQQTQQIFCFVNI